MTPGPPRLLFVAVLFISSAAIGYEILLMRLLSIVQWHHFAYMIISLALLGYGASGTLIAIAQQFLRCRFAQVFAISALMFSITMVGCFIVGQRLPFNALETIWDPIQLLYLSALYLVFFIPFFFAAICVGFALTHFKADVSRTYFFDLVGAGVGALSIIAILFVLSVQDALRLLALFPLAASIMVTLATPARVRTGLMAVQGVVAIILLFALPPKLLDFNYSPFKGLSQTLQVVDTRVLSQHANPLGELAVVESPTVPYRDAPGLSLNAPSGPPEQLAVFTDGDGMSVITRFDGNPESLTYLGYTTAALPYQLIDSPKVLILGAGAGVDVLSAVYHGASKIHAVELNPLMVRLVRDAHGEFAGKLYERPDVEVHIGEARGFVTKQSDHYDLIQVALLDSFSASGSGVQTLNESYLYTVEAFEHFIDRLKPGGMLSITRWLRLPPRDSLKLVATAAEALRRAGVASPGQQIAVIRSWNTVTLLVKNGPIDRSEVLGIREFSRTRSFDNAYFPGITETDANQFNQLDQAYLYEGAKALLSDGAADFIDRYKFDITPASDDRPYFFHFFKWNSLAEMLSLRKRGGAGMIEWAYLILVATFLQALIAGVILILVPLSLVNRNWPSRTGLRMGGYFFLLGMAFMFVEIAFIQKMILFLSHPLYSVSVVLSGFLVFAGIGSRYSGRLVDKLTAKQLPSVLLIVTTIAVIALLYLVVLPEIFPLLAGINEALKITLSLIVIAPLAFFMGMPFPVGLSRLNVNAESFTPWAWGLNGFASVISASLATLLAIELGFSALLLIALALYVFAALLMNDQQAQAAA